MVGRIQPLAFPTRDGTKSGATFHGEQCSKFGKRGGAMSLRALTVVWENSKATGTLLLLELAIADCANETGVSWPGIDYLAQKSRMSRRSIVYLLQKLEDLGELIVERNEGPRGTNRYLLPMVTRGATVAHVMQLAARPVQPDAPLPVHKVAPVQAGGGANCTTGVTPEPSGTKTAAAIADGAVEWPSEEDVLTFARAYPGNMAKGIPAGVPDRWSKKYWGWLTFRVKKWPQDWQREIYWRFEMEWVDGVYLTREKGDAEVRSGTGNGVWATTRRLEILKKRAANHPANELSAAYLGEPSESEWKEYEKLKEEIQQCEQQITGVMS